MECRRGDVWKVNLDPAKGREQAGSRPALIVSVDQLNKGPADLVVLVPLTTKFKGIPFHVELTPPEGGLKAISYAKCEDIRSVSKGRLMERWGTVSSKTMDEVEQRLKWLLFP